MATKVSLPRPIIRTLAALKKIGEAAPVVKIAATAKIGVPMITKFLGSISDPKPETALGLGLIKPVVVQDQRAHSFDLTAAGRKALEKALKELDGSLPKVAAAPFSVNPNGRPAKAEASANGKAGKVKKTRKPAKAVA